MWHFLYNYLNLSLFMTPQKTFYHFFFLQIFVIFLGVLWYFCSLWWRNIQAKFVCFCTHPRCGHNCFVLAQDYASIFGSNQTRDNSRVCYVLSDHCFRWRLCVVSSIMALCRGLWCSINCRWEAMSFILLFLMLSFLYGFNLIDVYSIIALFRCSLILRISVLIQLQLTGISSLFII